MDDIVPSFPLLHLPNNALVRVLRRMHHIDLLGLSLLSQKAKDIVKSLNVKVNSFRVSFLSDVQLYLWFNDGHAWLNFFANESRNWRRENNSPEMKLLKADNVDITTVNRNGRISSKTNWNVPGLEVRDWIAHIFSIFHNTRIEKLRFLNGIDFLGIEFILKTVNGLNIKQLHTSLPIVPNQTLEKVLTGSLRVKEIMMFRSDNDTKLLHKVLIQYLDRITFYFHVKLNDLLTINSKSVSIRESVLTTKDLNRFLKQWINGSNPRLRYMYIKTFTNLDVIIPTEEENLLNGIAYHKVPLGTEREFKRIDVDTDKTEKLRGGIDIRRNDGTKATVIFKTYLGFNTFEMFI